MMIMLASLALDRVIVTWRGTCISRLDGCFRRSGMSCFVYRRGWWTWIIGVNIG